MRYYQFRVSLDKCNEAFNTLDDSTSKICVVNKIKDININIFNVLTRINESKTLTKDISCKYKYKFGGRKRHSDQKWNDDKCRCECKNLRKHHTCKKIL